LGRYAVPTKPPAAAPAKLETAIVLFPESGPIHDSIRKRMKYPEQETGAAGGPVSWILMQATLANIVAVSLAVTLATMFP